MSSIVDKTLAYRRKGTENLIRHEGRDVSLYRPQGLVDDGAGGKKRITASDFHLPSRKRFFGGLLTMGRGVATQPERWDLTSLGEKYRIFAVLIGTYDDDIQADDYFFLDDDPQKKWVVLFVHDDTTFEVKAECGRER